ncbi:MAG: hypothetical protein A2359_03330 [Candidatus Moranbacteria bacterium RIFOXYB1_FULL_43_19]|nr:MAG: hypothetical protein A2359_03330 [Candidatus Moranbacteria bacterium RIFOXYB1_FULL_43_19]OGI28265.1 MAG: hypothetical protein A2184_04175 [Candidatus Moranbacteria bacterium RIFOXYA1_FULL_44_7]OGI32556.1 MAG: hypothetical protein A2420_03205 [Candidatus Moranbacteria bacterium RIFOXYC1_FULL_44_13]OGI38191.1 MAG: hypothetical protein A2612_02950 [Candidatus Moranbacteria bacterium RIFOXYD1_FULL_44_12]
MKKTLVVYYSKDGHTKKVAEDIAAALGADIDEIRDLRKRKGFFAWFSSGRDGMKKQRTEIETSGKNPADYDLIIAGSPVWGWNMVPAVRTYLEENKTSIKEYAFFVTSGNTSSKKIAPCFVEIMSRDPLAHVGFNAKEIKEKDIYDKKIGEFVEVMKK